jgi:hypothetical protein
MSNYYSGSATGFADLKSALITAATDNGWSNSSDELTKDGACVLVTTDNSTYIGLLGRTSSGTNPAPNEVRIGPFRVNTVTENINFPCDYYIFAFSNEVYLVINFDVDKYKFLAFGKSTIDLPGSGTWVAATGSDVIASNATNTLPIEIYAGANGANNLTTSAAFFHVSTFQRDQARNCYINHGFDGTNWFWQTGGSATSNPVTAQLSASILAASPNAFNGESLLIPVRAAIVRSSNLSSLALDCQHSRRVRVDYYAPGEVITIGSDQWKVFPYYKKNTDQRNGSLDASNQPINHTGTFGWALRYVPD